MFEDPAELGRFGTLESGPVAAGPEGGFVCKGGSRSVSSGLGMVAGAGGGGFLGREGGGFLETVAGRLCIAGARTPPAV